MSVNQDEIVIVTTNGRYTALRENDTIWSGFLPDAEVLGDDKEYYVSESVSEAIDSQWDAYVQLLAYLRGMAYMSFDSEVQPVTLTGEATPGLVTIDYTFSTYTTSPVTVYPITDLRHPTRTNMLAEGVTERWKGIIFDTWSSNRLIYTTPDDVMEFEGSMYMTRSYYSPSRSLVTSAPPYLQVFIPHNSPDELVYYDQVDRIAYILNLPEGFEYWVPVRGVTSHLTTNPKIAQRERIRHTTRAGAVARQFGLRSGALTGGDGEVMWRYYDDLSRSDGITTEPWYTEEIGDFLYGAYHLASLSGFRSSPCGPVTDIAGIVWNDIYHVLSAVTSLSESLSTSPPNICAMAAMFTQGSYLAEWYERVTLARVLGARIVASYPADVNPIEVGLSKIVTGKYTPITDDMTPSQKLAISTVQEAVRSARDNLGQRVRTSSYHKFWSDYFIFNPAKVGQVRTLAQLLHHISPDMIPRLASSLRHWLVAQPRSTKRRTEVEAFLADLEALEVPEGTCSI